MTLLVIASACVAAGTAVESVPPAAGTTPYRLDATADTAAVVGLGLLFGGVTMLRHEEPFAPSCLPSGAQRCRPGQLLGVDRYAVGKNSRGWGRVSDIAEIGGITLPFVADALDVWFGESAAPWRDFGTDALVMLEAQLAAGAVSNTVKIATNRPRPRQYEPSLYKAVAQSEQSFPCGHCMAATAGASSLAVTYWWRNPQDPKRYWVAAGCALWAGVGSWARVETGAHFPSDVMAGVGIGMLAGILVPWLHLAEPSLDLTIAPGPRGEATVTGVF